MKNDQLDFRHQPVIALFLLLVTVNVSAHAYDFGSFQKPFSANSLWNSHPVNPVFEDFEIPESKFLPAVHDGKLATQCFVAKASDAAMTVKGTLGKKGIYSADAESFYDEMTIPHWPAELIPAEGGDGHADIFDTSSGIIYSFWQLKKVDGVWRATHFGWMPMNGSGWGDPAHYHQGSRAAGIPSCAGIIRKHELYDGAEMYQHVLAMSLTNNSLSNIPPYVFPATISDGNTTMNTGKIPEGTLMMLPPGFDPGVLKTPELKKIANTLKVYGAYVVDMNYGTPYIFYVEIGSGLNMTRPSLDSKVAQDMKLIRQNLRMVKSADHWVDGNGKSFIPNKNLNLLSMRGPWVAVNGQPIGSYVSEQESVLFDKTTSATVQVNYSGRSIPSSVWANPEKGQRYKLTAIATGGAKLRLRLVDKRTQKAVFESKDLQNNETASFVWPADECASIVTLTSGVGKSSSIRGLLLRDASN